MPKSQRLITDFFKNKTDFFEHKKKYLITDYFGHKGIAKISNIPRCYLYNHKSHYQRSRYYLNKYKQHTDAAATHNGYLFYATNNFREYSVETVINRMIKNVIIPAGTHIASASIDDDSALENIEVELGFRRQGVGRNLIRFINQHDTQFHVYAGAGNNSRYCLTQEGAALIRACQHEGILNDEQVILGSVPSSPSKEPVSRYNY